jgi:hypothetical protein
MKVFCDVHNGSHERTDGCDEPRTVDGAPLAAAEQDEAEQRAKSETGAKAPGSKHNQKFDTIFSFHPEEAQCRASHFVRGLQFLLRDEETACAEALMDGTTRADAALARIKLVEKTLREFNEDPRAKALAAWAQERAIERETKSIVDELLRR